MWVYEYYLTHNNTIPSFVKFITFSLKIFAFLLHLFTNYNSYLFSGANLKAFSIYFAEKYSRPVVFGGSVK